MRTHVHRHATQHDMLHHVTKSICGTALVYKPASELPTALLTYAVRLALCSIQSAIALGMLTMPRYKGYCSRISSRADDLKQTAATETIAPSPKAKAGRYEATNKLVKIMDHRDFAGHWLSLYTSRLESSIRPVGEQYSCCGQLWKSL